MPRRHVVLAFVVAVCWAVNFVVIDVGLESFPPLLFAALRFGLTAFPAMFFVPRPDVRWRAVVAVGLFIGVGQFGVLFVAMNTGLPAGLASVIAPLQPVFTIRSPSSRSASARVCARSSEFPLPLPVSAPSP
jgi:O-acetylserine/cysteine efflux transporter